MFQSTHPRRVWLWKEGYERCWLRFQSTHPRRVWPHRGHTASSAVCFNPHTHAGCDGSERYKEIEALVSIHTPTQGVTSGKVHPTTGHQFQSTHPRRVWLIISYKHAQSVSFNPHTHAGCDRSGRFTLCCSMDVSIHTPTQGVTQAEVWKVWHRSFNPHTHAGCDSISNNIL